LINLSFALHAFAVQTTVAAAGGLDPDAGTFSD
jgi:hypothetical protein